MNNRFTPFQMAERKRQKAAEWCKPQIPPKMTPTEFNRLWLGDFKPDLPQHKEVLNRKDGICVCECAKCGSSFLGYRHRTECAKCFVTFEGVK